MNQNEQMYTTMKIIHSALMIGAALFLGVVVFGLPEREVTDTVDISQYVMFGYIASFMMVSGIVIGNVMFKQQTGKFKNTSMMAEIDSGQLIAYQTAMILRDALIEGPVLFALVTVFLLKGALGKLDFSLPVVQLPLAIVAVYFLLMLAYFPSKEKVKNVFTA